MRPHEARVVVTAIANNIFLSCCRSRRIIIIIGRVRQRMYNQCRSCAAAAARGRRFTSRDSGKTTPTRSRSATQSRSRSGGRDDDFDDEEHRNQRRSWRLQARLGRSQATTQRRSPFDEYNPDLISYEQQHNVVVHSTSPFDVRNSQMFWGGVE
jgi:hypothetical protein